MTLFYARQPGTGELAFLFRLTFGSALAACIVLGFSAIRRGDVPTHQAWMTRAYAIALAAGTQTFTLAAGPALLGPGVLAKDLSLGAAWLVNLAVAEVVIHRCGRPRPRSRSCGWARHDRARDPPTDRLRAAGRRAPRPALVGPARRPHADPRRDGTTTLTGAVADQAELHGILNRIRDLGVTLISVTPLDPTPAH